MPVKCTMAYLLTLDSEACVLLAKREESTLTCGPSFSERLQGHACLHTHAYPRGFGELRIGVHICPAKRATDGLAQRLQEPFQD
jgi:hypothetical protein